ncbi:MAG: hypothetical protein IJB17_02125 [Oscillospiraceae bacterium]|nr:hypothetical protein [Oscillospiraceae bacterium]
MKYTIDREHYHDFSVISLNKLPPRSYFIPFETRQQADGVTLLEKRYSSPKVRCLNGSWDFKFYPQPKLLPEVLDTDSMRFDKLDVPSCWQFRGYARPFYLNTRYQFPYDPPKIPTEEPVGRTFSMGGSDTGIGPRWKTPANEYNFVGVYRKLMDIADDGKRRVISFLGVASCLDLYVNGSFVGYSEGSHNTAEFDLTRYLNPGTNELLVVVRRWCTGTYLECQDMFRNNGIFRDVLLYETDAVDFWDVGFSAKKGEQGYTAAISAKLTGEADIAVTLSGNGLEKHWTVSSYENEVLFHADGLDVIEWNGEKPTLYDLYLELPGSCVKLRVGFKDVQIHADVFTLNSQKLKLRGVNHHDTSPTDGYYLTPAQIVRDMLLCKEYNIDTVRTSHYPPDPLLLEVCDEYGIYVVDEADLETHGTFTMQLIPSYNSITHDKKWAGHYLERVKRLYGRDKNHACILMWSLGNESGGYHNTDAMYDWLKKRTELPIHYESVVHSSRVAYDVASEMYPPLNKVRAVANHSRRRKQFNDRPYFMCEYAHAMGVGPGAVEEYWDLIYNHDNLMGGCVWEMVDHAVLHSDGSYTYGGDHWEWMHDSNFCVDGLFYPDRRASTGARLIRHVYRPIRIRHLGGTRFEIMNTMAFTPSTAYGLRLHTSAGTVLTVKMPDIAPLSRKIVSIPNLDTSVSYVTAIVSNVETGAEVSREQMVFEIAVEKQVQTLPELPQMLDFAAGYPIFRKDGKIMTCGSQTTILFRAPTDNDRSFSLKTAMDGFMEQQEEQKSMMVTENCVTVESVIRCPEQIFRVTDTYEGCDKGILVTSRIRREKGKGDLPRFGKTFRLEECFDRVRYIGRNGESYRDMKDHTQIATVNCRVKHMTEPNIRPQESGNRCDCSYCAVSDGETAFTFTAVDAPFELGIKPYSDWELLSMKHRADEQRSGTYVTVSAFQMGIGTGSCGPATLKKYRFDGGQEYVLRFIIG